MTWHDGAAGGPWGGPHQLQEHPPMAWSSGVPQLQRGRERISEGVHPVPGRIGEASEGDADARPAKVRRRAEGTGRGEGRRTEETLRSEGRRCEGRRNEGTGLHDAAVLWPPLLEEELEAVGAVTASGVPGAAARQPQMGRLPHPSAAVGLAPPVGEEVRRGAHAPRGKSGDRGAHSGRAAAPTSAALSEMGARPPVKNSAHGSISREGQQVAAIRESSAPAPACKKKATSAPAVPIPGAGGEKRRVAPRAGASAPAAEAVKHTAALSSKHSQRAEASRGASGTAAAQLAKPTVASGDEGDHSRENIEAGSGAAAAQAARLSAASAPASKQPAPSTRQPVVYKPQPVAAPMQRPAAQLRAAPLTQPVSSQHPRPDPGTGPAGKLAGASAALPATQLAGVTGMRAAAPLSQAAQQSAGVRPLASAAAGTSLVAPVLPARAAAAASVPSVGVRPAAQAAQRPAAQYGGRPPATRLMRPPDNFTPDPNLIFTFDSSDDEGPAQDGGGGASGPRAAAGAPAPAKAALTADEALAREMAALREKIAEHERLKAAADFLNSLELSSSGLRPIAAAAPISSPTPPPFSAPLPTSPSDPPLFSGPTPAPAPGSDKAGGTNERGAAAAAAPRIAPVQRVSPAVSLSSTSSDASEQPVSASCASSAGVVSDSVRRRQTVSETSIGGRSSPGSTVQGIASAAVAMWAPGSATEASTEAAGFDAALQGVPLEELQAELAVIQVAWPFY